MNNYEFEEEDDNEIIAYRYAKELNHIDVYIFQKLFKNWENIAEREKNELIAIVEKYSNDYNSFITGCYKTVDTITLYGNNVHYYIYFKKNGLIELWQIDGKYEKFKTDLYFKQVLAKITK
jgi:hypothetical protein